MNEAITYPDLSLLSEQGRQWIESVMGSFSFDALTASLTEGGGVGWEGILRSVSNIFFGEVAACGKLLALLAAVCVICAVINNLSSGLANRSVADTSFFACYSFAAGIGINALIIAVNYASESMRNMSLFMGMLLPPLTTLLIGSSAAVTGAAFQPIIFYTCQICALILQHVVTPLCMLSLVVSLLGSVTSSVNFDALVALVSKAHKYLLGIMMTAFAAILSISGFAASAFDSVAAKSARFAVASLVPVVGGSIAEALSGVAGASRLMKNALGGAGCVVIISLFAVPMIKIGVSMFMFRITAALTQSVTDARMSRALCAMADTLSLIFASIAAMGVLMIISVAAVMAV